MRNLLTAAVASLALAGGQAAASTAPPVHNSDRAASSEATANDMMGMPLPLTILALVIIIGFIVAASNNNDNPSSP